LERSKAIGATAYSGRQPDLGPVRTGAVVVAVGLENGKELWSRPIKETESLLGIALGGGPLYMCLSMSNEKGSRTVLEACDPATGKSAWTKDLSGGPLGAVFAGLLRDPGTLEKAGVESAIRRMTDDATTPAELHLASAAGGAVKALRGWALRAAIDAVPLVATGKDVLVPTGDGLVCLTPAGDERWRSGGKSDPSTPVIVDGRLYCALGEALACLDPKTGKELWRIPGVTTWHPFTVGGGLVFAGSSRTEAMKRPKAMIDLPQPKAEGVEDLIETYTKPVALPDERSIDVIKAYDAATGKLVWTADGVAGRAIPAGAKVVVIDTCDKFNLMDATFASSTRIASLHAADGSERWSCSRDRNVTSAVATGKVLVYASNIVATHSSAMMAGPGASRKNAITAISLVH